MRLTFRRGAWCVALAAVVIGLEVGVRLIRPCVECDRRPFQPPYQDQPWAVRLFHETTTHEYMRYVPLLLWAPREFSGEYVHVGDDGQRRTWNPEGLPDTAEEIDVFGGSATFGQAARDEYTWPSHLSRLLNTPPRYRVLNYAVEGYNLSQELIKFALLLRDGHRPSYAVFCDGENEVRAAYESGSLDATMDESYFQLRLNGTDSAIIRTTSRKALTDACQACDLTLKLLRRAFPRRPDSSPMSDGALRDLGDRVVDRYIRMRGVVWHLAASHGIRPIFLWQPVIFTEQGLVGAEQSLGGLVPRVQDTKLAALFRHVSTALKSTPDENFFNLSGALTGRATANYVDSVDLTEDGNLMIAQRVKEILLSH